MSSTINHNLCSFKKEYNIRSQLKCQTHIISFSSEARFLELRIYSHSIHFLNTCYFLIPSNQSSTSKLLSLRNLIIYFQLKPMAFPLSSMDSHSQQHPILMTAILSLLYYLAKFLLCAQYAATTPQTREIQRMLNP